MPNSDAKPFTPRPPEERVKNSDRIATNWASGKAMVNFCALLAFPAQAGIHRSGGHRSSPVLTNMHLAKVLSTATWIPACAGKARRRSSKSLCDLQDADWI